MKKFYSSMLLLVAAMFGFNVMANNLTITNVSLTGATANTIQVQYNMFWENSWRDLENWDAVWVFVKYTTDNGTTWSHATMSTSGHVAGTSSPGAAIQIPQDNLGAFVYRSSVSSGTFTITGQQLQWNFAANGLNQSQASSATVRVFGVEMVYIPQGEFYLGDGVNNTTTPTPSLNAFRRLSTNNSAAFVNGSLSETIQDPQYGNFRADGLNGIDMNNDGVIGSWPTDAPDFPIGFKAMYCMKHKITQGQYVDFLNTLTYAQQSSRVGSPTNISGQSAWNGATTTLPTHRNNIFVLTPGVNSSQPRIYTATRPDRDCNFLNWPDGTAYADWAGLRPFTDMEREKIGRGPVPPVLGEFAWGSTSLSSLTSITTGVENGQEVASSTANNFHDMHANVTLSGGDASFNRGPVRAGIFAGSSTTRLTSGSTYYGVMDYTGGLIEWVVGFSSLAGRSYTGLHGNGAINASGFADVNFWPGINGNASISTANTSYNGTTGVTSGAGAVFTGTTNPSTTLASIGPRYGTNFTQYTTWPLSSRFSQGDMNQVTTSTLSGIHTSYTNRYQQVGFRCVKSNL
jgi:formylglycine-generating enzyme required for sulfatase activity